MTTVTTTTTTVVSTSSISTTTTTVAGGAIDLFTTLGIIGTVFLIGLLIAKELLSSCDSYTLRDKAAYLDIVGIPMLFVFIVIVWDKIITVL